MDVLSNLGTAYLHLGNAGQALNAFSAEQAIAKELGNSFAIKTALTNLGLAYVDMGERPRAITAFESAAVYAQQAGDRHGQSELQWNIAEQHAELGQRDEAIAHGQAAVDILGAMNKPEARVYAEYLAKYEGSTDATGLGESVRGSVAGAVMSATAAPGLLRMALTAAKALTKHVASGLKTVSPEVYQRRLKTCGSCEHFTGVRCRVCGCFAQIKARLPNEHCPLEKWQK
jgi:tetratricopeptide (TPR) repeat protein